MEQLKTFVQKFRKIVVAFVGLLIIVIMIDGQLLKIARSTAHVYKEYFTTQANLTEKKQTLETLIKKKEEKEKEQELQVRNLKEFYKPIGESIDTESVIANEFAEILELMKAHSVKIYSIQYSYDPQDDNFVKNASEKYSVAQLNLQMVASYNNFKALLKELYKHEHFLDIVSVNIHPYENDKKILVVDLILKLYAQKN